MLQALNLGSLKLKTLCDIPYNVLFSGNYVNVFDSLTLSQQIQAYLKSKTARLRRTCTLRSWVNTEIISIKRSAVHSKHSGRTANNNI